MTVRCQRLRDFEEYGGAEDDAADQKKAFGVSKRDEGAELGKCDDVLEMGIGLHFRLPQQRRQLEINPINEADLGQGGVGNDDNGNPGCRRDQPEDGASIHVGVVHQSWGEFEGGLPNMGRVVYLPKRKSRPKAAFEFNFAS